MEQLESRPHLDAKQITALTHCALLATYPSDTYTSEEQSRVFHEQLRAAQARQDVPTDAFGSFYVTNEAEIALGIFARHPVFQNDPDRARIAGHMGGRTAPASFVEPLMSPNDPGTAY